MARGSRAAWVWVRGLGRSRFHKPDTQQGRGTGTIGDRGHNSAREGYNRGGREGAQPMSECGVLYGVSRDVG